MKRASVAAGLARGFVDFASACGVDRTRLLADAGVTEDRLVDQDARIPVEAYKRLVRGAKVQTADPALPLRFATQTRFETISIVGLIVHSSASVLDAFAQLNRYGKLMVEIDVMQDGQRFTVDTSNGEVWIIDNRPDPNDFPELTETGFGWFVGEFRRHFPDRKFALAMDVTHPEPTHAALYEEIYDLPARFGAARNGLKINPAWLTQEFEDTNAYVFGVFADKADTLMAALEAEETLRARVESLLLPRLHRGDITAESVASGLGMSRQTMYRRLRDEDVSFAEILDALRHRMAADYIRARKISVNQTAYLVGFSEPSSFVRAFKRWTGMTPARFRST